MGSYIIKATNPSGESGTIVADVGFRYTDNLNEINEAEIKLAASGSVKRTLLVIGSEIEIYRNGSLKLLGIIDMIDDLDAGAISAHVSGYEWWLTKENGSYSSSPYISTPSATIFGDIIGESSYFSVGTVNTGFDTDFRINEAQSLWNASSNLAKKTQQDIQIDYANKEVDLLNHRGSSSIVAALNDGLQIKNLRVSYGYPLGNKVEVYGKGDGNNQVRGSASDAASIATYGTITKTVIDRSVVSDAEAEKLAEAELALTKNPTKIYDFDLVNPDQDLSTGDHVYLNSKDKDLINEEVRIVGIERGIRNGVEYATVQVTNPEYKSLVRTRNKILSRLVKDNIDFGSYMQGSGNTLTWGAGINAKNGAPLKLGFYIPSAFVVDEANKIRIDRMTLDYDVDPFNKQYGTASFTGSDPQVQNSSGDESASVSGDSDSTAPSVAGDSGSTQPSVGGTSDNDGTDAEADTGTTLASSVTLDGSYTKVEDINPDSSQTGGLFINISFGRTSKSDFSRIEIYVRSSSGITYCSGWSGFVSTDDISGSTSANIAVFIPENTASYTYDVYAKYGATSGSTSESNWIVRTGWITLDQHSHGDGSYYAANHDHSDGSYSAANHSHADGTYFAANHDHPDGSYDINSADLNHIDIGDDVTEAGSVNATSVNIYLDFYDTGTSNWVNKHSITATGKTLDTEVDLTDGGTYPDAAGYWRVRIETDSGSADYVKGIVNIKHNLDN